MAEHKIDAIMLTGGTSLVYFTGLRWGNSERLLAVRDSASRQPVRRLPGVRRGPRARAARARARWRTPTSRTWQEDESPFERVAQGLKDRGVATGRARHRGDDEVRVRRQHRVGGAGAEDRQRARRSTAGCRMIKDAHELELMRLACEATLKCYEAVYQALQAGHDAERRRRPAHRRLTAASASPAAPACRSASTRRCPTARSRRRRFAKARSS